MTPSVSEELDFVITRTIKVPRAWVWRAWADPDELVKWWCPRPWTTEVRAFDLRPGGAFDTMMRGPAGEESPIHGAFLDVVPQRRIIFTTALLGDWRPAPTPGLAMTAIITMADDGDGTRYGAHVLHADRADRDRHGAMGFHDGWNTVIDQLEAAALALKGQHQ